MSTREFAAALKDISIFRKGEHSKPVSQAKMAGEVSNLFEQRKKASSKALRQIKGRRVARKLAGGITRYHKVINIIGIRTNRYLTNGKDIIKAVGSFV